MFSHLCRICLAQFNDPSDIVPLFERYENVYYYRICNELQLMVQEGDQLGSNICQSCSANIMNFYKFILTCKESDQKLREMLKNATMTVDELIDIKPNLFDLECQQRVLFPIDPKEAADFKVDVDSKEHFSKSSTPPVPDPAVTSRDHQKSQMEMVSSKGQIQCTICTSKFASRKLLEEHMREQHLHAQDEQRKSNVKAADKYECDMCSKRFISKTKVRQHLITHINQGRQKFRCVACGNQFCNKQNLKTHINSHNGIQPYVCSVCALSVASLSNLDIADNNSGTVDPARRTISPVEPAVQKCSVCDFEIRNNHRSSLLEHMLTHEPRTPCEICGKVLAKRSFARHKKTCVPSERPRHLCATCGKSYASAPLLARHTKVHSTLFCRNNFP